jgi:hypothetical protein
MLASINSFIWVGGKDSPSQLRKPAVKIAIESKVTEFPRKWVVDNGLQKLYE